jgi:hypothetical protein
MARKLLINLFTTFIISTIVTIAVIELYYYHTEKSDSSGYTHILQIISTGSLFLNAILFIMTIPSLYLASPNIWNNLAARLLLYFSGPIVFLITVLTVHSLPLQAIFYIIPAIIFIIIHSFFYYRLIREQH